jgi:hypothetical protein
VKTRLLGFALVGALACAGCTSSVFSGPVAISTRADGPRVTRRIAPIHVETCDAMYLIVPVPADPQKAYDALLEKAQQAGGNAVVDFQQSGTKFVLVYPFYMRACWEAAGTAAVVD